MVKRIVLTVLGLLLVIGAIAGVKVLQIRTMIQAGGKAAPPPETVTTAPVQTDSWGAFLSATGSLEAVQGVTVAPELTGRVTRIAFEPGSRVAKGDLLLQLDTEAEEAQLRAIQANRELAQTTRRRQASLLSQGLIAQADFDKAEADFKQFDAQADAVRAAIAKKTIRAPFAGRLGVRLVHLGQMLHDGDPVVSLQVLDPIFVNFQLPQQDLDKVRTGLTVRLRGDAVIASQGVEGKITTINPEVDSATRSVRVQATVTNSTEELRPGMFVEVRVVLPGANPVLTLPATAVLYAPYGDSVFVVEAAKEAKADHKGGLTLRQQFVRIGERRGDFVAVSEGLKEGESVVSTGVFKLRNGQAVVVDNSNAPEFKLQPTPENN